MTRRLRDLVELQEPGWCNLCQSQGRVARFETDEGYYSLCQTCLGRLLRFVSGGRSNPVVRP